MVQISWWEKGLTWSDSIYLLWDKKLPSLLIRIGDEKNGELQSWWVSSNGQSYKIQYLFYKEKEWKELDKWIWEEEFQGNREKERERKGLTFWILGMECLSLRQSFFAAECPPVNGDQLTDKNGYKQETSTKNFSGKEDVIYDSTSKILFFPMEFGFI